MIDQKVILDNLSKIDNWKLIYYKKDYIEKLSNILSKNEIILDILECFYYDDNINKSVNGLLVSSNENIIFIPDENKTQIFKFNKNEIESVSYNKSNLLILLE